MAGVEQAAVEAVDQLAVGAKVLHYQPEFGTVEHVHHLVYAGVDGAAHKVGVEQRLYLECHVAEYHGQRKALERTCAGRRLVPFALGVVNL